MYKYITMSSVLQFLYTAWLGLLLIYHKKETLPRCFNIMLNGTAKNRVGPEQNFFLLFQQNKMIHTFTHSSCFLSWSFPPHLCLCSCLHPSGQMRCATSLSIMARKPSDSSKKRSTTQSLTTSTRARSALFWTTLCFCFYLCLHRVTWFSLFKYCFYEESYVLLLVKVKWPQIFISTSA